MSRLDFETSHETKEQYCLLTETEHSTPPFDLQLIKKEQEKCVKLKGLKVTGYVKERESTEGLSLWHYKPCQSKTYQIFVPKILQIPLVEWYHDALKHPGTSRIKDTICHHYAWPGATKTINEVVRKCSCQMNKITGQRNYGHLPLTTTKRDNPWSYIHVDMMVLWTITVTNEETKKRTEEKIQALTCSCASLGWLEIIQCDSKTSFHVSKKFDSHWLCRYPRPNRVIYNNGGEFTGYEFQELLNSYGITGIPTTVKNPQANAFAERVHLTMGDMLRNEDFVMDPILTWRDEVDNILQSVTWSIITTVNTSTKHSPGQLAFGRDMTLPLKIHCDWNRIVTRRKTQAVTDNQKENSRRIRHEYKIGDKILISLSADERRKQNKIGDQVTEDPYKIKMIYRNGTVKNITGSLRRNDKY